MISMRNLILILLIFLNFTNAYALNYYKFSYTAEEDESFSSVLKKFLNEESFVNAKTPFVKKIRGNNPQIKDWGKIAKKSQMNLYISPEFLDKAKYKKYRQMVLSKLAAERKKNQEATKGLKTSLFYMSSMGIFNQKSENLAQINFKQNSPFTLGAAFNLKPENKLYSYSFSAYASYLTASTNNIQVEKITIPPEIGGNFYAEYLFPKYNFALYGGPDIERFSAFNLNALENEDKLYVDNIFATYLTLGVTSGFNVRNLHFLTKFAVSKTLLTTLKTNAPTTDVSGEKYSGTRFLFYLNYKINNKFYAHTLLKFHTMSGPSKLTSTRIGIGVGYNLF